MKSCARGALRYNEERWASRREGERKLQTMNVMHDMCKNTKRLHKQLDKSWYDRRGEDRGVHEKAEIAMVRARGKNGRRKNSSKGKQFLWRNCKKGHARYRFKKNGCTRQLFMEAWQQKAAHPSWKTSRVPGG